MILWAESNELATFLSQYAKQTLAVVEAAALLSPRKYEQMKDIVFFLMQLRYVLEEGLDKLQENVSLLLALGLSTQLVLQKKRKAPRCSVDGMVSVSRYDSLVQLPH